MTHLSGCSWPEAVTKHGKYAVALLPDCVKVPDAGIGHLQTLDFACRLRCVPG